LASNLRQAGIGTEVYPDAKKLGNQLKYADQKGFSIAIVAGGDEWAGGSVQVKRLATKEAVQVDYQHDQTEALVAQVQQWISQPVESSDNP